MENEELSSLDKLAHDVTELNGVLAKLQKHGKISEVFVSAITAQIRMLYRSVIARVCAIHEEEVTDEYIDIAMEKLPTSGYDPETGTFWDGVRFMTDDELRARIHPLIQEAHNNQRVSDAILETIHSFENLEDFFQKPSLPDKEPHGVMETLHNAINQMVDQYENDDLSDEEKREIEVKADALARNTIASLMGVSAEELPMSLVNYVMMGKRIEYMEDGNLMMEYVPYTDEEVEGMVDMIPMFEQPMEDMLREYEDGLKEDTASTEVVARM